jgi:hypothetical protein
MDALSATPSPNVVEICRSGYPEQVVTTLPGTLEGVSASNEAGAVIAPPSGGLVPNATDEFGDSLAVQLLVQNAAGPVNISNVALSAGGSQTGSSFIVGVCSTRILLATLNHIETANQSGNGLGVGLWLDGGLNQPTVTLENSDLQRFDLAGVVVKSYNPALTANIGENNVTSIPSSFPNSYGIYLIERPHLTLATM